jgi:hypothetical protein
VTGVAFCEGSDKEMLAAVTSALMDFEVEKRRLDSGATQIVVRPPRV